MKPLRITVIAAILALCAVSVSLSAKDSGAVNVSCFSEIQLTNEFSFVKAFESSLVLNSVNDTVANLVLPKFINEKPSAYFNPPGTAERTNIRWRTLCDLNYYNTDFPSKCNEPNNYVYNRFGAEPRSIQLRC